MRDVFDYFIKYVGSSAYRAPAFMNCMATIQFRHDLWYVDGGMYNLALGLRKLVDELGIAVRCNARSRGSKRRTAG
jgi:diapolycopene oxygenase